MRMAEALNPTGWLTIRRHDVHGTLVEERQVRNSIVSSGRDLVAKRFVGEPIKPVSHLGVGIGTTEPERKSALANQLGQLKKLNDFDVTEHLKPIADKVQVTLTADLDFNEGNGALTEAGLFNADSVMYNRVTFAPINKSSDFKLTLIWEVTF